MEYHAPSKCPVCNQTMEITRLHCSHCDTELNGSFSPCKFCMLDEKDMTFIEAFLRCKGSIKEVEKMLGVSYPTIKNMMDSALNALGFKEETREESRKSKILNELACGDINVADAIEQLKKI